MRIVQLTNDNRDMQGTYHLPLPWFGTAPQALLDGFEYFPENEIHVVSCTRRTVAAPVKLGKNIFFHSVKIPGWGMLKSGYLPAILSVRRLLSRIRPDIVHGQGTERDCSLEAVFSGFPNVITIHGNMSVHAQRAATATLFYRVSAYLERLCIQRSHGIVAISTYTKQLVEKNAKKVWLYPNAIKTDFFELERIPPPVPRVLFVGSLCERKNPMVLVKALEPELNSGSTELILAGKGAHQDPYYQKLREFTRRYPTIKEVGFLSLKELLSEFSQASVLVLPTLEDNCPMVVLEAQAAGVPVIATNVGGIPDLISDGETGFLFQPNDIRKLRELIQAVISNQALSKKIADSARKLARNNYHPKIVASHHLEIYREVLDAAS
jgi:glycosyltransferase involved in cell wall biosynthesis